MKDESIYNLWTQFINNDKYKKYFISNETSWKQTLNQLREYINKHDKLPSTHNENNTIKILGTWLSTQKTNYEKKTHIIKNESIYNLWTQFINDDKYKQYFINNKTSWKQNLNLVKNYIDKNNKLPPTRDKNDTTKKLAKWIYHQKHNYENELCIMKTKTIYNLWTEFVNDTKYRKYF